MHALTSSNEDPKAASKPFDKNRDGFVPSEGSAVLVLEKLENAINRGKEPIAEIVGYSCTSDAYHLVQPQPEGKGATNAMNKALSKANLNFKEINYINAHGTSTPANDKAETLAIKNVFNDHAYNLKINSTKSIIGHSSGAAGAMEAIACAKSIKEQKIHGTINYNTPDPECDLDYVPNNARETKIDVSMSNSFGFGGTNGTLIFKRMWFMNLVNGKSNSSIKIFDRGFLYGDAVFETILVENKIPQNLTQHLKRLKKGINQLKIKNFDCVIVISSIKATQLDLNIITDKSVETE